MALTKISRSLLDTGISDSSDATAITIDSSENVGIACTPHFPFDVQLNSSRRIGFNYSDSQNSILSHDGSGNIETLGLRGNTILFYSDYDASNPDGVERMRIDSSGNVGIGTSPTLGAFHVKSAVSDMVTFEQTDAGTVGSKLQLYHNSSSPADGDIISLLTFQGNDDAGNHTSFAGIRGLAADVSNGSEDGTLTFSTTRAGSFTEAMRIDSSGQIGVGTTSPQRQFHIAGGNSTGLKISGNNSGSASGDGFDIYVRDDNSGVELVQRENTFMTFHTNNTERVRINSSGNMLLGTDTDDGFRMHVTASGSSEGNVSGGKCFYSEHSGGGGNFFIFVGTGYGVSTTGAVSWVQRNSVTSRSINCSGTVNASGNDYAEYMKKTDSCGTINKGDVCGVDSSGKLTDVFNNAISFVIKSTNPSYVGGDTWAADNLNLTEEEIETERQKYDRIAFSGQVPVNITGSFNVGDYVYPQANGTDIECVAKSNPTFEEYQLCVGKIWATEDDGRPLVAVKIG